MESMMLESGDFAGTPQLDHEAWRALIRSKFGTPPEVSEPNAFAVWRRPLSVCGLVAVAIKISCNAHRIERARRDVRRAGVEDYRAVFQVAGRSALIQNDQAVELAGGTSHSSI
jgi:AraC family transcriptional regulator, positive regulator of tynA and feaB